MSVLISLLTIIYIAAALLLSIFSTGIYILLFLWWRHRKEHVEVPLIDDSDLPRVTVQLPIYNENDVINRLLDAVVELIYPRDKLFVQVLDDSTDTTTQSLETRIEQIRQQGIQIEHIRRQNRIGYKAGALDFGLQRTPSELIAVFDADFVPVPDFLMLTVGYFIDDAKLGILQTRWAHLNAEQNLITRSQAMSIDGHFVVEQLARSRGNLLVSFNGTAGIWRRQCIVDAGGWSSDTVAEDLDLSYRAQMAGWHYLYLPDVAVPAELPPQVAAYKRQQSRWAKGTTQNLMRLAPRLLKHPNLTGLQKYMGFLHLCQYLPQPLLLILTLLTPVLMVAGVVQKLPLAPLGIVGLAAPIMYVISQRELYTKWYMRLLAFPVLLAVGVGVNFSNTVAIIEAVLGRNNEFKRTPKFSEEQWQNSSYALRPDWTLLAEAVITLYLIVSAILAVNLLPGLVPFMLGQAYGYALITLFGFFEWRKIR